MVALSSVDDLDRYTYLVAGCVGEFWTDITAAHTPALRKWDRVHMSKLGVRFGKALQNGQRAAGRAQGPGDRPVLHSR